MNSIDIYLVDLLDEEHTRCELLQTSIIEYKYSCLNCNMARICDTIMTTTSTVDNEVRKRLSLKCKEV